MEKREIISQSSIKLSKNSPLVSIILPTYNRGHTVGRAIKSIQNQTFQDFECIIVDDASSDNTQEFLRSIDDNRIKIIRHDSNLGAGAARNTGIQNSIGSLIAFQDSDDEWLEYCLEKKVAVMEDSFADDDRTGVVFSQFIREDGCKNTVFPSNNFVPENGEMYQNLLAGNFISTQTALVRRTCIDNVGTFDQTLPCLLDWDLWIRISEYYRFVFIDEPLVIINRSSDSISSSYKFLAESFEKILHKFHSSFSLEGNLLGNHNYRTGNLFILAGDLPTGRRYIRKSIRIKPKKIKYWLAYFLSFCGCVVYRSVNKLKVAILPN